MRIKLTAAAIEKLRPPQKGQVDCFDRGYPGLAIRLSYGGAKTFEHFYRLHGKPIRRALGQWPSVTLSAAREQWRRDREILARGDDPRRLHGTDKPDTFASVAAEWLHRDQAGNRGRDKVARAVTHDAVPMLGDRPINIIRRHDVAKVIDRVVDRGSPIAARRLHAYLHRLFRWAVGRGILDNNPMTALPRPAAEVRRDRVLDEREITILWRACDVIGWPAGPAVQLLLLTGMRRAEVGSLRWQEIAGDTIRLAGHRTKNAEPRTVALSDTAIRIIRELPRIGDCDFVFTRNGRTAIGGWSETKHSLDAAAESNGAPLPAWRLHDLRRTCATHLQRLGVKLEVIESVLGHIAGSRAGIIGTYQAYRFEDEARAALGLWAAEIERIVSGTAPTPVIVPMQRRGHG